MATRNICAVIVGLGGTGSLLLDPLARLLAFHPEHKLTCIVLADGDRFERHNEARQSGAALGAFKADVAASRTAWLGRRGVHPIALAEYLDTLTLRETLDGLPGVTRATRDAGHVPAALLLVLAVDNHATRRDACRAVEEAGVPDALVLSPGNARYHGQVLAWWRERGRDVTLSPLAVGPDGPAHPEIVEPADRLPGGCMDAAEQGEPQHIVANALAATACLALVSAWLDGEPLPGDVAFDARTLKLAPSSERVAPIPLTSPISPVSVPA